MAAFLQSASSLRKGEKHMAKGKKEGKGKPITSRAELGGDLNLAEAVKLQPAWMQRELKAIRKYESKVLAALKDEANADLFVRDPGTLLSQLDIPMSGAFRQRLRSDVSLAELKKKHCFELPNGQVITPNIRIRFTKEED